MKQVIYLDYAAATPVDKRVLGAMQPYFSELFYNPSATYIAAKQTGHALAKARDQVAHWLGARPSEIIFTAGGTEANNLALHGIMQQYPEANVVVSAIEHDSVLAPAQEYTYTEVKVTTDGAIDLNALKKAVNDTTVLVSIMYANNEIGTIEPIREAAQLFEVIRKKRRQQSNKLPLYLHTDACQAANYLDLHVARLGVDLMTLNGGKLYGPKQSGALYVGSHVRLKPMILGGGQERGLRSGTENVAGSIGFATALSLAQDMRHKEARRLQELQNYFFQQLETKFPNVVINGSRKKRLPNNVHITIPGSDNERMLFQLDEAGILAAAGSACSASDEEPSHVLKACGGSDADARASLRFTMGRSTTEANIDTVIAALTSLVR